MSYFTRENYFCHEKNGDLSRSIPQEANSYSSCQSESNPISEVLKLIEKGFAVIPIHYPISPNRCSCARADCGSIGKHPLSKNGVKDATSDRCVVENWWERTPHANIGVATGKDCDLCVLDIDRKHGGFDSLRLLEEKNGPLPESTRVKTGGGGLHIFFRTGESAVKNRVNLVKGIDVRGDGAYVVAPPSRHASGEIYRWINRNKIEPLPEWLQAWLENGSTKDSFSGQGIFAEGQRNQSLASIAGYLRAKGLDSKQLEAILTTVNEVACSPALNDQEVETIAASIAKYQTEPWLKAVSLPKNLFTVKHICAELVPPVLRKWIEDVAERMQIPLEFVAAPAIVAASSLIGRKIGIRPLQHDDWTVVPNLWGFLVAEPGSMKSPAIAAALKPLENLQTDAKNKFLKNCQDSQKEERSLQREIEAIREALKVDLRSGFISDLASKRKILGDLEERQADKRPLTEKRYKTNDPTVEKLALILKENPHGILLLRDELSGWLESLSKNGREGNREFYLEAWNGNSSYTIDRIGRGTTHVDALCVSIFGGIQPDKLEKYINKTTNREGDDGFLERFQIVFYPKKPKSWRLIDRPPNQEAEETAIKAFKFLDQIEEINDPPLFLRFSSEAQKLADEWRNNLERRLLEEEITPIFKSHLSKYRSLMPSLSLVFSLTSSAQQGLMPLCVDFPHTQMAIEWCHVLETHMRMIYQKTFHDPLYGARLLAQKIKAKQVVDQDKLRDICRRNWRGLKTAQQLENAIDKLTEFSWAKIQAINTLGGKSEIIRINPNLPEEVEI